MVNPFPTSKPSESEAEAVRVVAVYCGASRPPVPAESGRLIDVEVKDLISKDTSK